MFKDEVIIMWISKDGKQLIIDENSPVKRKRRRKIKKTVLEIECESADEDYSEKSEFKAEQYEETVKDKKY